MVSIVEVKKPGSVEAEDVPASNRLRHGLLVSSLSFNTCTMHLSSRLLDSYQDYRLCRCHLDLFPLAIVCSRESFPPIIEQSQACVESDHIHDQNVGLICAPHYVFSRMMLLVDKDMAFSGLVYASYSRHGFFVSCFVHFRETYFLISV